MNEEIPKASLLRAGKDQDRIGIEFFGGQHGGQRIKICIDMRSDYFHDIVIREA